MIGIQFGYCFIYVDFSVVLDILIDLLFNLSTRNGRWPSQSRIISSRLPSFACFHPFVNLCLAHATIDMQNSYSSTNLTGSQSSPTRTGSHFVVLHYYILSVEHPCCLCSSIKLRRGKIRIIDRPVRRGVCCWQHYCWVLHSCYRAL